MSKLLVWLRDTVEQAAVAFVSVFLSSWVVSSFSDLSLDAAKRAAVAGIAAAIVVVKAAVASLVGNRSSASLQPNLPAQQVAADPKS